MRVAGFCRVLRAVFLALVVPSLSAAPVVSFGARSITASQVTQNANVVLFGVARVAIPGASMTKILRWHRVLADANHTGVVTFDLGTDVPLFSVWAVVDTTNGQ